MNFNGIVLLAVILTVCCKDLLAWDSANKNVEQDILTMSGIAAADICDISSVDMTFPVIGLL